MSTLEFTVLGLDFPVGSTSKRRDGMGLLSAPYQNTCFAVSTPAVPAEAVRRPYPGNIPAPTQKGLPQ